MFSYQFFNFFPVCHCLPSLKPYIIFKFIRKLKFFPFIIRIFTNRTFYFCYYTVYTLVGISLSLWCVPVYIRTCTHHWSDLCHSCVRAFEKTEQNTTSTDLNVRTRIHCRMCCKISMMTIANTMCLMCVCLSAVLFSIVKSIEMA